MADSLASPVRVQSFYEDEDIYTGREHLHPFMQKENKEKRLFSQKGFKVDIILWVLHNK